MIVYAEAEQALQGTVYVDDTVLTADGNVSTDSMEMGAIPKVVEAEKAVEMGAMTLPPSARAKPGQLDISFEW